MMQLIEDLAERQFDLDSESDAATKLENEKRKDELKLREKSTLFMKEKQGTPNCSSYNSSADIDMATVKRRRRPTFRALRSNREELLQYMNERDERAAKIKKIKFDFSTAVSELPLFWASFSYSWACLSLTDSSKIWLRIPSKWSMTLTRFGGRYLAKPTH